ncbi:MAG: hypothetical protein ACK4OM_00440 [Alphaproteobacteria bacterium]
MNKSVDNHPLDDRPPSNDILSLEKLVLDGVSSQVINMSQLDLLDMLLSPKMLKGLNLDKLTTLFTFVALDGDLNTNKYSIDKQKNKFIENNGEVKFSKEEIIKEIEKLLKTRETPLTEREIFNIKAKKATLRVERIKTDIKVFYEKAEEGGYNYDNIKPNLEQLVINAENLRDIYLGSAQSNIFRIDSKKLYKEISKIIEKEIDSNAPDKTKCASNLIKAFKKSLILRFTDEQEENIHSKLEEMLFPLFNSNKSLPKADIIEKFLAKFVDFFKDIFGENSMPSKAIKEVQEFAKISIISPDEIKKIGKSLNNPEVTEPDDRDRPKVPNLKKSGPSIT